MGGWMVVVMWMVGGQVDGGRMRRVDGGGRMGV